MGDAACAASGQRTEQGAAMTATAESPVQAARFKGRRGPLAGLLLRNLLFSILTLGIYRFWGRTRVRRFVWRHTVALDDVLEYLGTGAELFVGFLIALVVLLPLFAGYSVLQFVFVDGPAFAVLDLLYYLLLFFLIQIAIYRMRRYRLTRTAWRGVRFGLGGSSLAYAGIAFGYGLLTLATLGLAYPWMRVATLRYFGRHAAFGTAAATLTPSARYLFARWLAVVAPLLAAAAIFVVLNREESEYVDSFLYAIDHIVFWPLAILPLIFLAWIWYRIVEFRHMLSNLKIGNTGFVSSVRASFVFWRVLIYFLVLVGGYRYLQCCYRACYRS